MKNNVPNFTQKRVPLGGNPGEYGQYLAGKLPNITGTFNTGASLDGTTGAFYISSTGASYWGTNYSSSADKTKGFNARRISSIYVDNYDYVTPEGYSCLYIIKY